MSQECCSGASDGAQDQPQEIMGGSGGITGIRCGCRRLHGLFVLHVPFWGGLILGVSLVAAGTCGDLIESMIKRDLGIKDMSSFLPGHGGVMDRLDSLLLIASLADHVLLVWRMTRSLPFSRGTTPDPPRDRWSSRRLVADSRPVTGPT